MMSHSRRLHALFAILVTVPVGCNGNVASSDDSDDPTTAGDTDGGDDDGQSSATSTTAASNASATDDATGGDDAITDAGDEPETSAADGSDGETGAARACEGEGNCIDYPIDCEVVTCGGLSQFDENGCVRQNCNEKPCGEGERCYRPADFGGCLSSAFECFDDHQAGVCQCGTLPDCGGAFCIPEALYPDEFCFENDSPCPAPADVVPAEPCGPQCLWCASEHSCSGYLMCIDGSWTLVNPC